MASPFVKISILFSVLVLPINLFALTPLPSDEQDAQRMIASGVLDQAIWEKVYPYYEYPICVFQGELTIAKDLFPELPDSLPVSPDELRRYSPWNFVNERKLFHAYPELELIKPILYFGEPAANHLGKAGCAIVFKDSLEPASQIGVFDLHYKQNAVINGRVNFTSRFARWGRRGARVALNHAGNLTVGNYSSSWDNGFILGYYADSAKDSSVFGNWVYGSQKGLNGVAINGSYSGSQIIQSQLTTFLHQRYNDRIAGMRSTAKFGDNDQFSVSSSMIYFSEDRFKSSERYLYEWGLVYTKKMIKIDTRVASLIGISRALAGYTNVTLGTIPHTVSMLIASYAANFYDPHSSILNSIGNNQESPFDSNRVHSLAEFRSKSVINSHIITTSSLRTTFEEYSLQSLKAIEHISFFFDPIDFSLAYTWQPSLGSQLPQFDKQSLYLSVSTAQWNGISCQLHTNVLMHTPLSLRSELACSYNSWNRFVFTPYILGATEFTSNSAQWFETGIENSIFLINKNYTSVQIGRRVATDQNSWHLECQMWFSF